MPKAFYVILSERQQAKNPTGFEPKGSKPVETLHFVQGDINVLSAEVGTPQVQGTVLKTEIEKEEKMAKMKLNPLFVEISGTMGDFVFKKSRRGETIISRRPRKSRTEPSEAHACQPGGRTGNASNWQLPMPEQLLRSVPVV